MWSTIFPLFAEEKLTGVFASLKNIVDWFSDLEKLPQFQVIMLKEEVYLLYPINRSKFCYSGITFHVSNVRLSEKRETKLNISGGSVGIEEKSLR